MLVTLSQEDYCKIRSRLSDREEKLGAGKHSNIKETKKPGTNKRSHEKVVK